MLKKATIVHLNAIEASTPLVGGYLKAYAGADPEIRANWDIDLFSAGYRTSASKLIRHLVREAPDVVAFSVYTWNIGLVQRLLPALRGLLPPTTRFLLGGVEVTNAASRYVDPTWSDVVVCNGEGEQTFRDLLLELTAAQPDLEQVGGITFSRDGEWCTTPGHARIKDLTELPSPWLSGVFDGQDIGNTAFFETNRGCPFFCEFCYWGGAIGQKVYRQDLERIKEELSYIGKRGLRVLSIVDANFGILPRDVEIAEHIVAVSREHKGPRRIIFNSSKVHPERVEQISSIFRDAELLSRHVFSMQSMNPRALKLARRTSMEREPYRATQQRINAQRTASIVELVWPMPGETLDSFKEGIDDLCGLGAQGFLIYPLIWLNNSGYSEHTEEYGVTLLPEDDGAGGGLVAIQTREVPFEDFISGLETILAVHFLHDCRGLYTTLQLLNSLGIVRFRDAFDAFSAWMNDEAEGPIAELWRARLESFEEMGNYSWRGIIGDAALNGLRQELDRQLVAFVATRTAWFEHEHADLIRAAVEYDLLCRPYLFLQTPFELGVDLERIDVVESRPRLRRVRAPYAFPKIVDALRTEGAFDPADLEPGDFPIRIDHRAHQLFLVPSRTEEELQWMTTQAVQEIAQIEPRCTVEEAKADTPEPLATPVAR